MAAYIYIYIGVFCTEKCPFLIFLETNGNGINDHRKQRQAAQPFLNYDYTTDAVKCKYNLIYPYTT